MIQEALNGMITLLLAKFMLNDVPHAAGMFRGDGEPVKGFYDDPIKSNNPLDYVSSVLIDGIDFPSWSYWKGNWRYIPDPSEYLVKKYHKQMGVLAGITWERLKGNKPDRGAYLNAISVMTMEDYKELLADKWFLLAERAL